MLTHKKLRDGDDGDTTSGDEYGNNRLRTSREAASITTVTPIQQITLPANR